jgi:predicted small integral membrane protein
VLALLRERHAPAAAFNRAKTWAIAGLTLGFLTWQFGFMTVGGEWFGMWMSKQWNGAPSAFRFAMVIIAVLIFVAMRDEEIDAA